MKQTSFWFSLTEVIVGVTLLTIAGIWVSSSYSFLLKKDEMVENSIMNMYFHKYVFDIASKINFPESQVGSTFYLWMYGINTIWTTKDPSQNTNSVWFFDDDVVWAKHRIEVFSVNTILNIPYTTYKITTEYNNYEKISYLSK